VFTVNLEYLALQLSLSPEEYQPPSEAFTGRVRGDSSHDKAAHYAVISAVYGVLTEFEILHLGVRHPVKA